MKNRIIAALLAVITIVSMMIVPLSASASEIQTLAVDDDTRTAQKQAKLDTMSYVTVSEDGSLALYVDINTGEMGIKNTVTGEITLSNPADAYSSGNYERASQVYINYFAISSGKSSISTLYGYKDSFAYGQSVVVLKDNGVSVHYSLGEEWRDYAIPVKISIEKLLNALTEKGNLTEKKALTLIKDNFTVFDPNQNYYIDNNFDVKLFYLTKPKNNAIMIKLSEANKFAWHNQRLSGVFLTNLKKGQQKISQKFDFVKSFS